MASRAIEPSLPAGSAHAVPGGEGPQPGSTATAVVEQKRGNDQPVFGVLAVLGLVEFAISLQYRILPLAQIGPGFFPASVGALMCVGSTVKVLSGVGRARQARHRTRLRQSVRAAVLVTIAICYVSIFDSLGFLLATGMLVAVVMFMAGEHRIVRSLVAAAVVAAATDVLFGTVLNLYLPPGVFSLSRFL